MFAGVPGQARAQAPPGPYWNVDHGQVYCSLARDYGPGTENFGLRVIPGTTRVEMLVANRSWRRPPFTTGQAVRIVLSPDEGPLIEAQAVAGRLPRVGLVVALLDLGEGFVDRFAGARQMRLMRGERTVLTFDLPNAGSAVAALRECFVRTLADWGMDAAARARLRSLPTQIGMPFHDSDYPMTALGADAQGVVIVRLMIGVDGRVSDCILLRSSGNTALDDRTCRVYRRDGRFNPAIGEDGQPVAEGYITWVTWRIM